MNMADRIGMQHDVIHELLMSESVGGAWRMDNFGFPKLYRSEYPDASLLSFEFATREAVIACVRRVRVIQKRYGGLPGEFDVNPTV